ncbi:MAG: tail fiber protein, partial [Saprospiraceae bacterium]
FVMAEPFLSEIRIFSFNFAPQGWAMCNGQLLPINQNQALFSLLGTTYGGNGQTNFALPDLRGRAPIHFGSGTTLGQAGGEENHTLTQSELPTHVHTVSAIAPPSSGTNINTPGGAFLSNSAPAEIYSAGAGSPGLLALAPATISNIGGSQAHTNMQPILTLNLCIALQGIFPSRN